MMFALRVGMHSGQQYASFDECSQTFLAAERLGFDMISLFDHYRPPMGGADGYCLDGLTTLAAIAAVTSSVRCGLMVAPPTWRHPALLAAAGATIDQISHGRFELGIGIGGSDLAYTQYGIPFPAPEIRAQMAGEAATIIRALWSGPATIDGQHFSVASAHVAPGPVQRHVPIVIGGLGPRLTLPLVAQHADIWNTVVVPIDVYRTARTELERRCDLANRDVAGIRLSMTFRVAVADTDAQSRQVRADLAHRYADTPGYLDEYLCIGTPDQIVAALLPYLEFGVRDLVVGFRPPIDRESMARFATEVVPVLRTAAAS